MPRFPRFIHVTEEGESPDRWFEVHLDGVQSIDANQTPIAIYRLVKTGRVMVTKTFSEIRQPNKHIRNT